jgi:Peptidase family S41
VDVIGRLDGGLVLRRATAADTEALVEFNGDAALVDALLAKVRQHYLFADRVEPIERAIRRRLADGAYDAIDERQGWTLPHVPGARSGGTRPLYLLTGPETFSGAESFAYELQARKRAVVVGARTRGGAHFSPGWWVTPHVALSVPSGRPVSPVTGGNWEGPS